MEKAKHQPDNPKISGCWRPVIQILLGLSLLLLICGISAGVGMIPMYEKVSSVRDWNVPPETEVIGFDTLGFNPFRWCDEICIYVSRLYIASDLSIADLEDFYRQHYSDLSIEHIGIFNQDTSHDDGRPIYAVIVRWVE